jgi:uncharacterized membrane protein YfcA
MAAWLLAPLLGLAVGAVLALTGAGGAILAVPLLLFGLHLGVAQAAPISLLAVALSAAVGTFLAWRARTLRYRAAAVMAASGLVFAPVGQWLSHSLPERPLTLLFAAVLALAAARTLTQARRELEGQAAIRSAGAPCRLDPVTGRLRWQPRCAGTLVLVGASTGLLSGLLGVGGGFVLVPALLLFTDLAMPSVVATSMGVIALVSLGTAMFAAVQGHVAWDVAAPFALGAIGGMVAARAWAQRLRGPRLQQGFAVLSLAVAAGLVLRAVL